MPAASLLVAVDRSADHLAAMHNASWVAMRDGIMGTMFPQALDLPHDIATQDFTPNVESVRALNPDVVIQWSDAQLIGPLENAGLKVIGLKNTGKQEDVDAWIAMFAAMLGKPERATQIKARSDQELDGDQGSGGGPRLRGPGILYFNRFTGGLKAAAAGTYNDFYIKLVGGTIPPPARTRCRVRAWWGWTWNRSWAGIRRSSCWAISTRPCRRTSTDPVWQNVSAVRSRRVYKVPLGGYRWDPPGQESPLMWHWLRDIAFPQDRSALRGKVTRLLPVPLQPRPTERRTMDRILWTEANGVSPTTSSSMLHEAAQRGLNARRKTPGLRRTDGTARA